jgi:hypothetical protein
LNPAHASRIKPKTLKWVVIAPSSKAQHLEVRIMGLSENHIF